jgi:glycosyltransferase involved in cell wall biosynthesis
MPGVEAPPISICIPMRNGADWIDEAIDSVLEQTRGDFELLVVDNASTDRSGEIVERRTLTDERIRLERFEELVSAPRNHNRAVRLARGRLIKFLHADDVLFPDCVERMAALLEANPNVGFVFSRREILLAEPDDAAALAWKHRYGSLHSGFGQLGAVNNGLELLAQYLPTFGRSDYENWIAEPSAVMVRRSCFERVALFSNRMRQSWDLELWLRAMAVYDVGFIDEELVAFRFHPRSLTARNARRQSDWLDLLWLYEGLLGEPGLAEHHAMIRRFRRRQLRRTARKQLGRVARGDFDLRPLGSYLAHRAGTRAGNEPAIHG